MKKQKKPLSRAGRIDKYLYKNSYFYKWGKKVWKSRAGRAVVALALVAVAVHFGYRMVKAGQVRSFLLDWQSYQNNQQYTEFMKCVDMSPENPYSDTFPDWEGEFFQENRTLLLKDISVKRSGPGLYQARARVVFMNGKEIENQFRGLIFIREDREFKIIRVET